MESTKKITLPVKIIIIGCITGLIIAGIGGLKQLDSKRVNKERSNAALKQSETAIKAANKRLKEIEKEYNALKEQYEAKEQECDSMNMSDPNWYVNKNKCERESSDLSSKMTDLEQEDFTIKNKDYAVYYRNVDPMSYQIFYIIGASIAALALLGAFIIYLVKGNKSY